MRARDVELDTVVGGVCVYLLIGLCFAMIYRLLFDLAPGAFVTGSEALEGSPGDESSPSIRLLYFSLITLTTVGYGDITPHGDLAQMASSSEALLGQLYLAIFIARMMGLYMGNDRTRGREARSNALGASLQDEA